MNKEELTDDQKLIAAADTLNAFFDGLGPNDIYKQILLQVLFEELQHSEIYNNNNLFIDIDLTQIDEINDNLKHDEL